MAFHRVALNLRPIRGPSAIAPVRRSCRRLNDLGRESRNGGPWWRASSVPHPVADKDRERAPDIEYQMSPRTRYGRPCARRIVERFGKGELKRRTPCTRRGRADVSRAVREELWPIHLLRRRKMTRTRRPEQDPANAFRYALEQHVTVAEFDRSGLEHLSRA